MANSIGLASLLSLRPSDKPGILVSRKFSVLKMGIVDKRLPTSRNSRFQSMVVKAAEADPPEATKARKSLLCPKCEGNGAILCTQCEGSGVNSEDHFNGRFKAGGLCWLCRGKKEILCGNCNGAGFMGGFMSTADS